MPEKMVVDKNAAGRDVRQYHIGVAPGEVGTVALLPGDPFRVPFVAEFLTDVKDIAHNREHRTMTGFYKGKLITATSTGMICACSSNLVDGVSVYADQKAALKCGWMRSNEVALDTAVALDL